MEYRRLGASGFSVPALSFGTGTFGGKGELFGSWGNTDVAEARRLIDICLDAGVSMFDTADVNSTGESERILGVRVRGSSIAKGSLRVHTRTEHFCGHCVRGLSRALKRRPSRRIPLRHKGLSRALPDKHIV